MSGPHVAIKDRGYRRLMRDVSKVYKTPPYVEVGVFGPAAQADGGDGLTVGEIADVHEFGRGNNPERSWLRAYVDGNRHRIDAMIRRVAEAVVQRKMTAEQGFELLGLQMVGEIKARIQSGISPALSAAYAKRKGADKSTPLIRTGQFIGSIVSQVRGGRVTAAESAKRKGERAAKRRAKKIERAKTKITRFAKKADRKITRAAKNLKRSVKRTAKSVKRTTKSIKREFKRGLREGRGGK